MASRYEDRRHARGWDREEDEGWGNINRDFGRGYNEGRSDFSGREEEHGQSGRRFGSRGSSGYGRGFDEERREYRSGSAAGRDREDLGGYGGYRSDRSEDLSGGGMYGGGMGGYSGGGYQGYTGGMSSYGGANYGGRRDYSRDREYNRDREGSGRYGANFPESERGYMTGRGGQDDRGWFDRASDEVASWFGDEEAERRREMDARQTGQHRGRGPRNYTRSDDRIRDDINDRLTDHDYLDASDIEVEVNAGEVVLTGTVENRRAKRLAEDIAEDVSGVRNVENRIRVKQGSYGQAGGWTSSASATDPGASARTSGSLSTGETGGTTGTTTGATGGTTGTTGSTAGKSRGKSA
jgi:osmotically-inducible protein OsmY